MLEGPWGYYIFPKQMPNGVIPSISAAEIHKLQIFLLVSRDSTSSRW